MHLAEHVVTDYQTMRLSLKAHPMSFLRARYYAEGIRVCADIAVLKDGTFCRMAGLVLVRQRPGEGKAVFMTLEDETGIANVVLWQNQFQKFRREVMTSRLLEVRGKIQKSEEGVVHLMTAQLFDRSADLRHLSDNAEPAGSMSHPRAPNHPRNARIIPKSRDFH
jgi:error-prone DNA polymerase